MENVLRTMKQGSMGLPSVNKGKEKDKEDKIRNEIPHKLIDVVDADEEFSVAEFAQMAKTEIENAQNCGKFLLASLLTGLTFSLLIYTFTLSFGDIGKAGSVVLLVMQVAGTGGTFPIECAPKFFRAVYPLLPFTHSMAALRESVGGCYGNDYWIDLAKQVSPKSSAWISMPIKLIESGSSASGASG